MLKGSRFASTLFLFAITVAMYIFKFLLFMPTSNLCGILLENLQQGLLVFFGGNYLSQVFVTECKFKLVGLFSLSNVNWVLRLSFLRLCLVGGKVRENKLQREMKGKKESKEGNLMPAFGT